MITRRDVLSDAVDDCMKELYSFAKPSIEWDKFMEENKIYSKVYKEWERYRNAYHNREEYPEKWEEIKSEYVQAAHHGNNSAPGYFYDYVGAKEVWFEAPKSLMESDEHTAKELKEYLEGNGVVVKSYMTAPNVIYFK